jgi:predicted enzyme involved in methoxymalonyl-ACP biosynthesis
VEVVEAPADPAEYVRALQAGLYFEAAALTQEDREKTRQYQQERERREAQQAFASTDDYLRSLDMRAEVGTIDEASLPRCAQLIAKTNQFNLTTRRHGIEEVRRLAALPGAVALTLRVADRFGDHGLVSVLVAVPQSSSSSTLPPLGGGDTAGKLRGIEDEEEGRGRERYEQPPDGRVACEPRTLRVDTWLMSCRVIGRTVEEFLFNVLLARARELGYGRILGEYLPTAKNAPVKDLYDRLGFARQAEAPDGAATYLLEVSTARPAHTLVAGS